MKGERVNDGRRDNVEARVRSGRIGEEIGGRERCVGEVREHKKIVDIGEEVEYRGSD